MKQYEHFILFVFLVKYRRVTQIKLNFGISDCLEKFC